jgi:hypothetical protein
VLPSVVQGPVASALEGPTEPSVSNAPSDFSGSWSYNEEQSLNAATGRPETAAAGEQRQGVGRGRVGQAAGFGASGGSIVQDALFNLYLMRRDTRRDLLEIAPRLDILASASAVTVTDDLDRVLEFPADGAKRKYQIGAAVFEARASWDRGRFVIDIEGPDGLKMSEALFLSKDGSRLFVVIRVGEPAKTLRPVGVNRVYDRVAGIIAPGRND